MSFVIQGHSPDIVYGGFGALGTHNAKRMLAYSTLAQIGFVLVGIGWGTPLSLAAALVFTFNHALIKAAMLMLAGAMASRASVKSASFSVIIGVGKYHPFAGALFLLGGLALAVSRRSTASSANCSSSGAALIRPTTSRCSSLAWRASSRSHMSSVPS